MRGEIARMRKRILLLFLVFALFISIHTPLAFAGEQPGKNIRVALFIETGGTYNLSLPAVTFTGESGFEVISKSKNLSYLKVNPKQAASFRLNQYRILVEETSDLNQALSIVNRLNGFPSQIITYTRKGKTFYRIVTGDESTYDQAWLKLNQLKSQYGVGKEILGPYALTSGSYQDGTEANKLVNTLLDAGFDAYLAHAIGDTNLAAYQVVIGNEATEAELTSLLQEVSLTFPALNLSILNNSNILLRQNLLDAQRQLLPQYLMPVNETILLRPLSEGGSATIGIAEKENRQYRGVMELAFNRGKLAVINELPLEEYLFSVVGTEMATGWPMEALKAQAVIARSFVLSKGNRYGIADVTDTTYDQAYYGVQNEAEDVRQAVLATRGQVLVYQGSVVEALYSSNAGGITAVGKEAWGKDIPYLTSVQSPDNVAQERAAKWYRVERENGTYGYVHSDYVVLTANKNPVGLPIGEINGSTVNFRTGPGTSFKSLDKFKRGEKVVILETVNENNAYNWVEGPIDGLTLMNLLNSRAGSSNLLPHTAPIESLKVVERGPSGRVTAMTANHVPITVSSPDSFRTVLGGLKSTLFEVEEMGSYTLLGSGGTIREYPKSKEPISVVSAGNRVTSLTGQARDSYVVYGKTGLRVITTYPSFRFIGQGYGHGIGLSQWGARGLAEQGYDYKQILKHYYSEQVNLLSIE